MTPNSLEVVNGMGHFHLCGAWRFGQAVQAVAGAIAEAERLGLARLLVVATEAVGFDSPSTADRHAMVREWARASVGRVVIAMVVPPTFIDPDRFGIIAARNFGMHADVFSSEAEARAWLLEVR